MSGWLVGRVVSGRPYVGGAFCLKPSGCTCLPGKTRALLRCPSPSTCCGGGHCTGTIAAALHESGAEPANGGRWGLVVAHLGFLREAFPDLDEPALEVRGWAGAAVLAPTQGGVLLCVLGLTLPPYMPCWAGPAAQRTGGRQG